MGLMIVDDTQTLNRGLFGKIPDFLTKSLDKPGFGVGSKIKGAIGLGKILYKTGAYKKVGRYYGYRYRKIIGAGVASGAISSQFINTPGPLGEGGNYIQQPRIRRKQYRKCPPVIRRKSAYGNY